MTTKYFGVTFKIIIAILAFYPQEIIEYRFYVSKLVEN